MTTPVSWTHVAVRERSARFDAPFVCCEPDCDEAIPAPSPVGRDGWADDCHAPAAKDGCRALWARAVPRVVQSRAAANRDDSGPLEVEALRAQHGKSGPLRLFVSHFATCRCAAASTLRL